MFTKLFRGLREEGVPVTLREYLDLLQGMEAGLANFDVEDFYYLARSLLVKDERNLDRFDRVFGEVFKGLEREGPVSEEEADIPKEWLEALAELLLTEEERRKIEAMGGWDKLMEELQKRLHEQKGRHQGGSKWIGTPMGVRIGQKENRNFSAVKVWDRRDFADLDDRLELGTRGIKLALRRLRRFAREGAADELDLEDTIRSTAKNAGYLDLKLRPERHNAVKVLLLLDVGGSMDWHVQACAELFSAARAEFKHLEHYYFHNCPYERLWRENRRRRSDPVASWDVLHTYAADYKLVFVGDAAMSPYELAHPGGSVEHWNEEPGETWMKRFLETYPKAVWLNPLPQDSWDYYASVSMVRALIDERMFPLTLEGIEQATRALAD
jgi:uncharacterized protein with von Willebrand factor type A (vWA) domain